MTQLPDPLVPAEVNLRGLPFMPLYVQRLMDSDLFGLSTGDEFKAALALWCRSWSQEPAGSLPTDDRLLAFLSGSKSWKRVKKMALHGWVQCSDGRLYHPVVATAAIEAWERRTDFEKKQTNRESRQQRWRARVKELSAQLRALGVTPPANASLEHLERLVSKHVDGAASTSASTVASTSPPKAPTEASTSASTCRQSVDGPETALTETETEEETKTKESQSASTAVSETVARALDQPPPTVAGVACRRMRDAGVQRVNPGDPRLLALLDQGVTPTQLGETAAELIESKGAGVSMALVVGTVAGRMRDAAAIAALPPNTARKVGRGQPEFVSEIDRIAASIHAGRKPADPRVIDVEARDVGE